MEVSGRYVVRKEKIACSLLDGSWGDSTRLRGFEVAMISLCCCCYGLGILCNIYEL